MPNKYHFLTCNFDITLAYNYYITQVLRNDFFNITKNHHSPSLFFTEKCYSHLTWVYLMSDILKH